MNRKKNRILCASVMTGAIMVNKYILTHKAPVTTAEADNFLLFFRENKS